MYYTSKMKRTERFINLANEIRTFKLKEEQEQGTYLTPNIAFRLQTELSDSTYVFNFRDYLDFLNDLQELDKDSPKNRIEEYVLRILSSLNIEKNEAFTIEMYKQY
jgi:hypothetical protein